jgi:hypothetical protein
MWESQRRLHQCLPNVFYAYSYTFARLLQSLQSDGCTQPSVNLPLKEHTRARAHTHTLYAVPVANLLFMHAVF